MEPLITVLQSSPWASEFVFHLLIVWPLWVLLRRIGKRPAMALVVFVPLFGPALVLAYAAVGPWPAMHPAMVEHIAEQRRRAERGV